MQLDSTLETIGSVLPEELNLSGVMAGARSFAAVDMDFIRIAKFLLVFSLGALILSILGRFILGKHSSLNRSVSSVMAIVFLYSLTVIIYTCNPWTQSNSLSPLPFVTFFNDYMVVMPVAGVFPTALARELLSLILLAFWVNLSDTLIPAGNSLPGWLCLRFLAAGVSMSLYLAGHWVFNTYAPGYLLEYAPLILLILLFSMLVLGFLNAVLGLVLTITNPIIGALYTFFFSNLMGKQVTKAVFTSGILSVILFLIDRFGFSFVHISLSALSAYVPVALVSLGLWYLIGHRM